MLFVTGPSGAGKSTLLKLIYLAERPSAGSVMIGERNLAEIRSAADIATYRRSIGVVFQDHRLLVDHSVFDNVALPLFLRGRRSGVTTQVEKMLKRLHLSARANAPIQQLSAGEQQRVGIARALVGEPQFLIADEPIGNLDPELSEEVMTLFSELSARGIGIILASHDLPVVKRMKRRVLVLDHGRLVDDIAPEDLADA